MNKGEQLSSQNLSDSSELHSKVIAVCDACGRFIEYWGFKSIHGRVWAYLALSSTPRSQTELARALGVSRGLVSAAISELAHYNLVNRSGSHHHSPCEANLTVWPIISKILNTRELRLIERAQHALEAALHATESMHAKGVESDFSAENMRRLLQLTMLAQTVLGLILNTPIAQPDKLLSWFDKAQRLTQRFRSDPMNIDSSKS